MGTTKIDHFMEEQNKIAVMAKALGHPARIAIIEHLLKVNACIGNDILEEIPLAQPTISRHLKILRNANLIKGTVEGTSINYCIYETTFELLSGYFKNISTYHFTKIVALLIPIAVKMDIRRKFLSRYLTVWKL